MNKADTYIFRGCKYLQYNKAMSVPRQGINLAGQLSLCYARFDVDNKLQLVQFCKRGRMNYVGSGIVTKCCIDYEEVTHTVEVPIWELNSSPRNFGEIRDNIIVAGSTCNGMCLLSEWDENKPRDCENCSGRMK